ncbi:MAG: helix-turn-helix domain-containing protein [Saccharofermentanales bacterium]
MYDFSTKSPKKIFISIFAPFLLCIIAIIIVLTSVLFFNFQNIAQDMAFRSNLSNLRSIGQSAKSMNEILRNVSLQVFFDDTLKNILYYPIGEDPATPYSRRLYSYKNAFSLIESIYIYNGTEFYVCPALGFTYKKETFQDDEIVAILDDMGTYHSNTIIPRYVDTTLIGEITNQAFVYSYLFYDSQLQSGKIEQAVVINISEDFLHQSIAAYKEGSSNIQIIDDNGITMKDDDTYPALSDLSEEKYISRILDSIETSGYFIENINGRKSLVTYIKTDVMNWKFISITPYEYISQDITRMRSYTLIFTMIILLFGIAASILISRSLFKPVHSMARDADELRSEKRTEFSRKKQMLIAALVNEDPFALQEKFTEYDICLDLSKPFCVLLIKIDDYVGFSNKFGQEDRSLMKFAAENITRELLSEHYCTESADMGTSSILILINKTDNLPLTAILEDIKDHISRYLELSVTVTIGRQQCSASELSDEYNEVVKASDHRMISGYKSTIFADEVEFLSATDFTYPDEKVRELIESLMLGQTDNAKMLLKDILIYSAGFGRSSLDACLLNLILTINNSILTIERNNMIKTRFNFDEFVDQMRQSETLEQHYDLFFSLFDSLSAEMENSQKNRHEKLIEQVTSIIWEKYASHNLCLDEISDSVRVSPYYLTKLFKKYKMISISDYIHNVRLEKAREMIQEEDIPISLVMERTGFTSRSHFYNLFKKAYGVSPKQYRTIL